MLRLLRQHQSFETSIVRVRVVDFSGWRFGCIVADETKPKPLLIQNRIGFERFPNGLRASF